MQKKSTHPEKKKHKKHSSPSKKSESQKKSTKKQYSAFKSTHLGPCSKKKTQPHNQKLAIKVQGDTEWIPITKS